MKLFVSGVDAVTVFAKSLSHNPLDVAVVLVDCGLSNTPQRSPCSLWYHAWYRCLGGTTDFCAELVSHNGDASSSFLFVQL